MLAESLTCENPKLLEVLIEHIIIQWDDICEKLFDELVHEEVQELNHIEYLKHPHQFVIPPSKPVDKSLINNFQEFKSVDIRDIMSVFEDYNKVEKSIKNRL